MALRGDYQGGAAGLAGGGVGAGLILPTDKNIAIEQYCKWNWAFFIGAVLVVATALGTMIHWLQFFTFAPATFFFEFFFLLFGLVMVVLDLPLPHMSEHRHIQFARQTIYKYLLFMTRFMGRGAWYLFLATMVWGALWDTKINWFLGLSCTLYLTGLGIVAMGKGLIMTNKLNNVREKISHAGFAADRYCPPRQKALTQEQFKLMVESVTSEHDLFTPEELAYVMSALSFQPYNQGQVTLDELGYWLMPGPPLMV